MLQREIDPEARADIDKFEEQLARYLAGDLEEDAFRVFRLNNPSPITPAAMRASPAGRVCRPAASAMPSPEPPHPATA